MQISHREAISLEARQDRFVPQLWCYALQFGAVGGQRYLRAMESCGHFSCQMSPCRLVRGGLFWCARVVSISQLVFTFSYKINVAHMHAPKFISAPAPPTAGMRPGASSKGAVLRQYPRFKEHVSSSSRLSGGRIVKGAQRAAGRPEPRSQRRWAGCTGCIT